MKYSVCSYWLINWLIINRLINRYEVFCMFTGFKWLPPSQLHACTNCETTCKMDAIESRSYLQPVVSLLCGNTSVSKWTTALKGSRTICTLCKQKVAHGGGTTNLKNRLRTKHCSTYVWWALRVTRRLRDSSFETFVQSAEVKEVPPHSCCSTTVNWLTDT